jgi:WhiB family redox-sensing transcriptional regulator
MKYPEFDGTQSCSGVDTAVFFAPDAEDGESAKPANYRMAKQICGTCSWQIPCLQWALTDPGLLGVWGGTSERDRSRIRGNATRATA